MPSLSPPCKIPVKEMKNKLPTLHGNKHYMSTYKETCEKMTEIDSSYD